MAAVALVFSCLSVRLLYLQYARYEENLQSSDENRLRRIVLKAERGLIFDRNGTLLVGNRPSYQIVIKPAEIRKMDAETKDSLFKRLIHLKDSQGESIFDSAVVDTMFQRSAWKSHGTLRILEDASEEQVSIVQERSFEFPSVTTVVESRRSYPYGTLAAHLLGYTGEISDELFGYKYADFAPSAEAFQQESEKRIRELHMYDVLRADRCISVNSLEARVPFGDLDFAEYVMDLDPALKLNTYGKGKYLLRHAFEGDWLPHDILMREKAAFSDAVGHSMVDDLKEYAEAQYTDEEFEQKRRAYTFAQPFTKESLLYRELFEKFYPGQAHMVAGFWMPNKAWKGCDVQDPSARVLANYGDSGK